MVSPRKLEANRRNALKSTGPRTPEGKARSRLNAVTHGMTGKTLVLPGEDAGEFDRRLESWTASLRPCNPFEEEMVRDAVESSWRLDRADRLWAARLAERAAEDPDEEDRARRDAVEELGRRLWGDPSSSGPNPEMSADGPDDPARLVDRLEATADGCRWLLDRWAGLRRALDEGRAWSPAETLGAIRMLGKRPEDADLEPEVLAILAAGSVDERAREVLREIVDEAAEPLLSMERHHRDGDEARAAMRARLLEFDESPEAERLRRFELRDTRAVLRIVGRLRQARRRGYSLPKPPSAPRPAREPSGAGLPIPPRDPSPASVGIRPEIVDSCRRPRQDEPPAGDPADGRSRETRAPGLPRELRPPRTDPSAAPAGRPRPSLRAVARSAGRLGSVVLALALVAALRPMSAFDADIHLEISSVGHSASTATLGDGVGTPDHAEMAPAAAPETAFPAPNVQKRQNEPTEWTGSPPSRAEWRGPGRPAGRSRGPPGRGGAR